MNRLIRFLITGLLLVAGSSLVIAQSDWNPEDPPEPSAKYRITTKSSPYPSYTSGDGWYSKGDQVWISTSSYGSGYKFMYWTKNGEKYSEEQGFSYTVEGENVEFVACYEYSPENPSEPDGILSYRLYLQSNLPNCCSFYRGSGGKVKAGEYVWLDVYSNQGYSFLGWYVDDELISAYRSFNYQMPEKDVTLTARFEYSPDNPYEPDDVTGPPRVYALSYERTYGSSNPAFGYFKSRENVNGEPIITCEANEYSPVGTYPIKIERGSLEGDTITLVNGVLTITKAPLTISACSYTRNQGDENPDFWFDFSGFKNYENYEVLTTMPTASCEATKDSPVGEYVITVSGAEAANYEISYVNGTLTVVDGPITVTANSYTRYYGDANPAFEYTSYGSALNGTPVVTCDATETSQVGTYPITVSQGDVSNADVTYVNGVLTILPSPLTINAGTYRKKQGDANPTFTPIIDGFKNGETQDVLTGELVLSCDATQDSPEGEYDIIVSGVSSENYDITYVAGKLIIRPASFITGGDDSKDEDDSATYIVMTIDDSNPTVAVSGGDGVSGKFSIPETVVHNGVTYTVTEIVEGAFENNTQLTDITIPASITSIKGNAFKGCSNLKSITIYVVTPINLSAASARSMTTRSAGSSIFEGVNKKTCILYVPEGSVDLYKAADVWNEFVNIRAIGSTGINGVVITNINPFDVYDLSGRRVRQNSSTLNGLSHGVYIVNGKKVIY